MTVFSSHSMWIVEDSLLHKTPWEIEVGGTSKKHYNRGKMIRTCRLGQLKWLFQEICFFHELK